ncbi:MAG: sigma 54-interacting transcriptional regulator [Planctomycetaceae bacterium]
MTDRATASGAAVRRVLVVDDDRRMASGLARGLCAAGWHASAAGSAAEALRAVARGGFDACVVDVRLPDDGAVRVAQAVVAARPTAAVVGMLPPAAEMPVGLAADAVVAAPVDDADLAAARDAGLAAAAARGFARRHGRTVLGSHPAMLGVRDLVERVAATPATVLVTGESGTGKSLLAREIHRASGRAGRFVEVACGSLAESLLESELFGHVAGAFTGATCDRDGRFLQADGGTIFLDEIATASPALQVKLLRVLQEREFEPVGGGHTRSVDVRVILATHEDLEALVAAGRFRADLFWRINVVSITMPPLRDRPTDVPALAEHFLRVAVARAGREVAGFTAAALDALASHAWPGNVRELEHAVERAVFLGRGRLVDVADLPPVVAAARETATADPGGHVSPIKQALAVPERQLILDALARSGWRRDAAARALGINRTTLYKKLKRLGMRLTDVEPVA